MKIYLFLLLKNKTKSNNQNINISNELTQRIEYFKSLANSRNITFNINIDVYDPWIDHKAERNWYKHGVVDDPLESDKQYDAIIVAVGHDQFKAYKTSDYDYLSKGEKVIIDIKNIVTDVTWKL